MSASLAHERRVQAAGEVHGGPADDHRPAELVRPREDDGGRVRDELEQVLERGLCRGEGAAVVGINFLSRV